MLEVIGWLALLGDGSRFFERRDVDFWNSKRAAPAPPADLWADSTAPAPVRRLLEAPGRESAAAYLAWQEERFKRLRAAMAAVEEVQRGPLLVFSRDGCRWCALQEEALKGLPVTRVPAESPLWKEHDVTVTPTLLVRGTLFRGYTPREAILKELDRDR